MKPCVSVLMSVYNGEQYLASAVESILNQTFADYEFIIIDDGSSDATWNILQEYTREDGRIVLHRNHKNMGLAKSLNHGLLMAKGEYIARQDADDVSLPSRFSLQIRYMERHPEIDILGTGYYQIDEEGKYLSKVILPEDDFNIHWIMLFNNAFCHTSVVLRHNHLEPLSYDDELMVAQDYELWSRLTQSTQAANLPFHWLDGENRVTKQPP